MKKLLNKFWYYVNLPFLYLLSHPVLAQESVMDKLGNATEEVFLTGDWRVKLGAGAIVIVGIMFMFGKLVWQWALAIVGGIILIASAPELAEYFFNLAA